MKHATRVLICIFLLAMAMEFVQGLGISPGSTRVEFQPNLSQDYTLKILNNDGLDGNIVIGAGGALAEYITLSSNGFTFETGQERINIVFNLKLPETLNVGRYEGKIVVSRESPGQAIGAQVVLVHRVLLDVPPKYGRIVAAVNGTPGMLLVSLTNPREETASGVNFSLQLNDRDKPKFKFSKRGIFLGANTTTLLKIPLNFSEKGEFLVNYTIAYQTQLVQYSLPISLGAPNPRIEVAQAKLFAGQINPLDISIENDWNTNFTAKVRSFVYKGKSEVWNGESQEFIMPAYKATEQRLFIDATRLEKEEYSILLELWYGKHKQEFRLEANLTAPELPVEEKRQSPILMILSAVIVLGLAIAVLLKMRAR